MTVTVRPYQYPEDFELVGNFLVELYQPEAEEYNQWLQPRWEYMHYHPYLFDSGLDQQLDKVRIWEDEGKIVGVTHFELSLGEAYFEIHPEYAYLKAEMLEHAEQNFYQMTEDEKKYLRIYMNESDEEFAQIAEAKGYSKYDWHPEYDIIASYDLSKPVPEVELPRGFKLQSLEDENDLAKIHRVIWRGFNHAGEPDDDLECRRLMQSAPNFRKDLNIVVVAPDGNYVSYSGMFYDVANKIGYVEPVATDPDYRGMGLGKAAVLESVRRVGQLGGTQAFVETGKEFYLKIGFQPAFNRARWYKTYE